MPPTPTPLEASSAAYARSLRELVRHVERTQDLLLSVAEAQQALALRLSGVRETLIAVPSSEQTQHALRFLAGVERALRAVAAPLDARVAIEGRLLSPLREHAASMTELAASLCSSTPEPRRSALHAAAPVPVALHS